VTWSKATERIMFLNYLKIAFRNIKKHKGYSLINLSGLAIGITVCLLILIWVLDETSFDRFHSDMDNLYRVVQKVTFSDGFLFNVAVTPDQIGPALKNDYPGVVEFARFRLIGQSLVSCTIGISFLCLRQISHNFPQFPSTNILE
jgi:putative ABC transport system permease protein